MCGRFPTYDSGDFNRESGQIVRLVGGPQKSRVQILYLYMFVRHRDPGILSTQILSMQMAASSKSPFCQTPVILSTAIRKITYGYENYTP